MTGGPRLRIIEGPPAAEAEAPAAQFTRLLTTPPGAPWRQRQIADLEARLGSPLAGQAVAYRLTRTEPWKLGAGGRFAVVYARDGGLTVTPAAGGGAPTGAFERLAAAFEGVASRRLLTLAITIASLAVFGLAVSSAVSRRAEVRSDLVSLDQSVDLGEHRAHQVADLQRQASVLNRLGAADRSVGRLLSDMDWVAAHRRPEVAITSFHWIGGIAAVEAATADSPFANADRPVQRASHPVRPGVWLWGVVPAERGR